MYHVFEHVAAIKGDHWDEVGKAQQDVHPHKPKQETRHEEQHIGPYN